MMRIDCHCHTMSSWDALTDHAGLLRDAAAAGLDAIIVTDHGTLDGVRRLMDLGGPVRVIPGVEVPTADGEFLACFVDREPPRGKSVLFTIDYVHDHGGVAVIPHPFALAATERVRARHLPAACERADAIEGYNARTHRPGPDERARELAARLGKPLTAGSDAHLPGCVGRAYLEMPDFTDAADFLAKLPTARPVLVRRATLWENLSGVARTLWLRRPLGPAARRLVRERRSESD